MNIEKLQAKIASLIESQERLEKRIVNLEKSNPEDAEKIEHVLGENVVRQLEKHLDFATRDPHGRTIPSSVDIHQGSRPSPASDQDRHSGYGGKE